MELLLQPAKPELKLLRMKLALFSAHKTTLPLLSELFTLRGGEGGRLRGVLL